MIRSSDAALPDPRRKAAIVVRFLLTDGLRPPLAVLPEDAQVEFTREMGRLGLVDRATLNAVIAEFADALEGVGLAPPSGDEAALGAASGHISPAAVTRLRTEAARRRGSDPWTPLAALGTAELAAVLGRESAEAAAVALSKLPVARAAEVLGRLHGPQARRTALAISRTAKVAPEAVLRIGGALAEEFAAPPSPPSRAPRARGWALSSTPRLPPRGRRCWAGSRPRTAPSRPRCAR